MPKNNLRIFSEEHKKKISESRKKLKENGWIPYNVGLKSSELVKRKNMIGHLKRNISLGDLEKYKDFEKLKFLNNVISRYRKEFEEDEKYIAYLDKFYNEDIFNILYNNWISSGKDKWYMPSLEHKLPKSRGGTFDLQNLVFTTWFENRAKAEMTIEEWKCFRDNTNTKSNLFYL